MQLKILLPFRIFLTNDNISRIVARTTVGSIGILPHRLDFVAAITPGILAWQIDNQSEVYAAVDVGILVKTGEQVLVSVRNAVGGTDLNSLHDAVTREFIQLNDEEKSVRTSLSRLEIGLYRQLSEFHHE